MTGARTIYERLRPLIIWLGITELAWITFWFLQADKLPPHYIRTVMFWTVSLMAWLGAAAFLGKRGLFLRHTFYFSNLAGFLSVLIFTILVFGLMPSAWTGLVQAAKNIPEVQLAAFHMLRLLVIGTIIKYLHGELPRHFMILGSLTDLAFAVSAIGVTVMVAKGMAGQDFLIVWHLIGSLVFLGAGVSMFFSVPSPLRITNGKPDTSIVFRFPMLLAPNFTVPLFVVAHGIALVKLIVN